MVDRKIYSVLTGRLSSSPAVALLGPRQAGKTTLAKMLQIDKPIVYLDLERPSDMAKLSDPELYLGEQKHALVILDEIQRKPDLFPVLRSLIDERRQSGERNAQFLLLGSASPDLLRQGSETLAGRISYLELTPFLVGEVLKSPLTDARGQTHHWFRGGYPESFLATSHHDAMLWCTDLVTSYVERYMPQRGASISSIELRRFFTMLAHRQAATINLNNIGGALGIDSKTVKSYVDILESLFMIRRLPAWTKNVGKRLVKSPKVFVRDSGILHSLLVLQSPDALLGHPIAGHSWEAYCLEQILAVLPSGVTPSYYRTHAGAEIDLVLEFPNSVIHAIEIKRTLSPTFTHTMQESMRTIGATKATIVVPGGDSFPLAENVDVQSIRNVVSAIDLMR